MNAAMINEIVQQDPRLEGMPDFRDRVSYTLQRYMGAGQGDSTGDEAGTSSDDSDDEGSGIGPKVGGVRAKILRMRAKVLYLTSLKHLCLHTIIQNESVLAASSAQQVIFQKMGEKHPEVIDLIFLELRPRDQIPYYTMMHRFQRCELAFIKLLLHKSLLEFNLDLLRKKYDMHQMLSLLAKQCPLLTKINSDRYHIPGAREAVPFGQLKLFRNLVEINMPRHLCNDYVMEKISNFFPNLRSLEVTFDKLSTNGLKHLFKLQQLERLEYFLATSPSVKEEALSKYNNTLIGKCLANLPNLRLCQPHRHAKFYMSGGLEYYYKNNRSSEKTLKLETLRLYKSLGGIPPDRLPMVKHVTIVGPITCAKELAQLSRLESLTFKDISTDDSSHIMTKLGRQIKRLIVRNEYAQQVMSTSEISFDFYEIFFRCPNLEILDFRGPKFCEIPTTPLTATNFSKLRSVEIQMFDMQGYQMPMPIVEHILRVENLEHLHLYWTRCLPKALFNVLAENNERHFRKLKFLYLTRMWVKNHKGYIRSLKTMLCRMPVLELFGIDCCGEKIDEFKNSGLHQILNDIPGLDFKTDYKDGFY